MLKTPVQIPETLVKWLGFLIFSGSAERDQWHEISYV